MQIIADRRALHRIPETEKDLPKTFQYLEDALSPLSCRVFRLENHGLCAWFDFGKADAIAFRADADALPIPEKTGAEYASCHPGKMHACGHDGHMAIGLELARRLSKKETLPHNVLLVFQAGEESPGGAKDICETGVFAAYHVKAIFGLHLWPKLEKGKLFSRKKEMMARASEINVDVYGRSAHVAQASRGIDSIAGTMEFFRRAMEMEAAIPEGIYRLLKFGRIQGGTVRNALSAHTHLEGSLRAFQDDIFEGMREKLYAIAREVEEITGCRIEISLTEGYPAVMNPEELWEQAAACVELHPLEGPCMTAEDFSFYQKHLPGLFFFLGLGENPALHADTFDFDETVLIQGADFFETLAETFR